jgi:hypothetical protein
MEIFNYCNQCKKSLNCDNFDKKKNGDYYTRCKVCRKNHNENERKKYVKKEIPFESSFASYNEKTKNGKFKVDCWHPIKNDELIPRDIAKKKNKKYWFHCDVCSHDFEKKISNITSLNGWCPYCVNQKLCDKKNCSYCFNKSFASYDGKTINNKLKVDCWHPTKNNKLIPRNFTKKTGKKCWFKCDICQHEFDSSLDNISGKNKWCPYCANNYHKLCNNNNCNYCYNNSFISYQGKTQNGKLKVDCWHPTKNNEFTPRNVTKRTEKKYWFKCDNCFHDFNSSLSNISKKNKATWCPYCSIPVQKTCNDKCCNHCFNKSFASYKEKTINNKLKVDCWHPTKNGKLTPRDITISSGKKYWFKCDNCFHDINILISNITRLNSWCPYCCIPVQKLCNEEGCTHCFNNSFASYDEKTVYEKLKVDCWHPTKNGNVKPRDIFKNSGKKYWFQCDMCQNSFETRPNHVTGKNSWCPNCKNKTELKLYNWLLEQDCIEYVKREYKPKWCSTQFRHINKKKEFKNGKYQYRYDFLITFKNNKKLIIELDGDQHFKQVMNWKTPLENQIRDKYKEFLAKKHKIPLTRCIQEDVYMDRNNWEQKLKRKLQKYN